MLVEIKAKVKHVIDHKTRAKTDTFVLNRQFFAEAEYEVMQKLNQQVEQGLVECFEIQSLRLSSIKEVATQYQGEYSFTADLRDTFVDDNGNEKKLKYKILLWADSLQQAYNRAQEIASQGYDMYIESIRQQDIEYIPETSQASDE